MEGLENKLANVHVGDLIRLRSPEVDVAGYVVDFNPKQVKLSHEDPFSDITPLARWDKRYRRRKLGSGNRRYNLRKFESFKVLVKYKPVDSE